MTSKFATFLESLRNKDNKHVVSTILEAYQAIFEYPSLPVGRHNLDLHVEDKLSVEGKEATAEYLDDLIENLLNNDDIHVDYTRGFELKDLDHPKDKIDPQLYDLLLNQLNTIKQNLRTAV